MSKHNNKRRRHQERTVRKDRLRVKLSTMDDYPHRDIVLAEVRGWGAHEWAEWDGYIGGDSWETAKDMPGYAYAMPVNSDTLVEELLAEGYVLDLSDYDTPEESCEACDCEDEHCGFRPEDELPYFNPAQLLLPFEGCRVAC